MKFAAVLHTDDGRRYGVTIPDLPGCFSGGNSIDDALDSAREAIDLHVEGLIEEGLPIPERRPIAEHQTNTGYAGGIWAVIDVPVEQYLGPAERINITVPQSILTRIDSYAKNHGMSRSGFLVDAARRAMGA
jgi:predicted RNase H-like HicB family nuclease